MSQIFYDYGPIQIKIDIYKFDIRDSRWFILDFLLYQLSSFERLNRFVTALFGNVLVRALFLNSFLDDVGNLSCRFRKLLGASLVALVLF